jgi:hypothetical protein
MNHHSLAPVLNSRFARASLGATLASFFCGAVLAQDASGCQPAPAQQQAAGQQRACGAAGAAARVVQASGPVILQRAGRVTELVSGETLRAGDRVLSRTGTARISLGGACVVNLSPSSVATIGGGGDGLCLTQREVGSTAGQANAGAQPTASAPTGAPSGALGSSGGVGSGSAGGGVVGTGATGGGFGGSAASLAAAGGVALIGGGVIVGVSQSKSSRLSP